jgi:hypothetical protein
MSASLFISSTPFDLALHRNKIADALSQAKSGSPALRVVLAAPETGLAERLRLVRQASAYVGVFGMVYGNVDAPPASRWCSSNTKRRWRRACRY